MGSRTASGPGALMTSDVRGDQPTGKQTIASLLVLALLLAALSGTQPAAQQGPDPGVTFTRLIDRAEIRVSRVVLQPGATRRLHSHDDVQYHVWVPLEGSLELSVGTDAPVPAVPGDAFFFAQGTMHGFTNVGTTDAAVMEVFVKEGGGNASGDVPGVDALGLQFAALLGTTANAGSAAR